MFTISGTLGTIPGEKEYHLVLVAEQGNIKEFSFPPFVYCLSRKLYTLVYLGDIHIPVILDELIPKAIFIFGLCLFYLFKGSYLE